MDVVRLITSVFPIPGFPRMVMTLVVCTMYIYTSCTWTCTMPHVMSCRID